LAKLSGFIHHDLDYDRIQRVGIGSVSDPNTSFRNNAKKEEFSPIGRWKRGYSAEHLVIFEKLVGKTLQAVGYELATANTGAPERHPGQSSMAQAFGQTPAYASRRQLLSRHHGRLWQVVANASERRRMTASAPRNLFPRTR